VAFPGKERAYEKHAWVILFVLGISTVFFAVLSLGNYATWLGLVRSPDVFPDPIEFSAASLGYGIFLIVVARVSFRKGERLAWYFSWYLPISFALLISHDLTVGGSKAGFAALPLVFLIVSLLGLLLPYRKFFPKTQTA
jgi:hypothetical protein